MCTSTEFLCCLTFQQDASLNWVSPRFGHLRNWEKSQFRVFIATGAAKSGFFRMCQSRRSWDRGMVAWQRGMAALRSQRS
jgi:hypothetical protein